MRWVVISKKLLNVGLLGLVLLAAVTGCSSTPKLMASGKAVFPSEPDKARVVFLRYSSFAALVDEAFVFVLDGDEERFIGQLPTGRRIQVDLTPGKHTFMVSGSTADFMNAELVAGKTYYVIVTPHYSSNGIGFSPWPIRKQEGDYMQSSDQFKKWLAKCKPLTVIGPAANDWLLKQGDQFHQQRTTDHARWLSKSAADVDRRTLHAEDGV